MIPEIPEKPDYPEKPALPSPKKQQKPKTSITMKKLNPASLILLAAAAFGTMAASAESFTLKTGLPAGSELTLTLDAGLNVSLSWGDGSTSQFCSTGLPTTVNVADPSLTVTTDGTGAYTLTRVTRNGRELDENAVYSVLMLGDLNFIEASYYCNCPMPQNLLDKLTSDKQLGYELLVSALSGGNQLKKPSDYVTIRSR